MKSPADGLGSAAVFSAKADRTIRLVRSVSLGAVIEQQSLIDLLDIDVQGAEVDRGRGRPPWDRRPSAPNARRKRAAPKPGHVSVRCSQGLGWTKLRDYAVGCEHETPYSRIDFGDGIQTWPNPKL
jgi:hypothetical protein